MALGLALVVGFAFLLPYLSDVKDGPDLGTRPVNGASLLALLLVLGPINGLLLWRARQRALTRAEVLTVYAIVAATAGLSTTGFSSFVTIMATASQYFASPENRWAVLVQPHIPLWLTVNQPEAIRWLWEGLPEHQAIPWAAWRQPLFTWGLIGLCMCAGSFCLLALMRRDWIEGQRLAFLKSNVLDRNLRYTSRVTSTSSPSMSTIFTATAVVPFGAGRSYLPSTRSDFFSGTSDKAMLNTSPL